MRRSAASASPSSPTPPTSTASSSRPRRPCPHSFLGGSKRLGVQAEIERAKAGAQKEADGRVRLESKLREAQEEASAKGDRLEKTEQERSDLLKQVTQLTGSRSTQMLGLRARMPALGMISTKEADSTKQREELASKIESLLKANRELQSEVEHQREKREAWEEKFGEKEEVVRQLRKDLDRKELRFYHELREKDNRVRQLDMQNLQIRFPPPSLPPSPSPPGWAWPGATWR